MISELYISDKVLSGADYYQQWIRSQPEYINKTLKNIIYKDLDGDINGMLIKFGGDNC